MDSYEGLWRESWRWGEWERWVVRGMREVIREEGRMGKVRGGGEVIREKGENKKVEKDEGGNQG